LQWWYRHFVDGIEELLNLNPDPGFWVGRRFRPSPLEFDLSHPEVLKVIRLAAIHKLRSLGQPDSTTDDFVRDILESHVKEIGDNLGDWMALSEFEHLKTTRPLVFEKDDDANGHVDFILAAANNRAKNYGLPSVSWLETKRVAGNIVPAICTIATSIAGLACLGVYRRTLQPEECGATRGCINLATNSFDRMYQRRGKTIEVGGEKFTPWDFIKVPEEESVTIGGVVSWVQKKYGVSITTLLLNNRIVFDAEDEEEGTGGDTSVNELLENKEGDPRQAHVFFQAPDLPPIQVTVQRRACSPTTLSTLSMVAKLWIIFPTVSKWLIELVLKQPVGIYNYFRQ